MHEATLANLYTSVLINCLPFISSLGGLLMSCAAWVTMGLISLWDIRSLPTRSVFTFFQTFLNFWSNAPKCRHLGGGMCMLFEICEKTPFQKCMG